MTYNVQGPWVVKVLPGLGDGLVLHCGVAADSMEARTRCTASCPCPVALKGIGVQHHFVCNDLRWRRRRRSTRTSKQEHCVVHFTSFPW